MTDNIEKRARKVVIENLSDEQADSIGFQLGERLGKICDKAAQEVNEITKIYGVTAKVVIQLIDEKTGKPLG